MSWWRSREPPKAVESVDDKMRRLRETRTSLETRLKSAQTRSRALEGEAVAFGQARRLAEAKAALRRKHVVDAEIGRVDALLTNVEGQLAAIDTVSLSASVATSMRDGAAIMDSLHQELGAEQLHDDIADMRLRAREAERATRAMTAPLFSDASCDDDDIDEELGHLLQRVTVAPQAQQQAAQPPAEEVRQAAQPPAEEVRQAAQPPVDLSSLEAELGV